MCICICASFDNTGHVSEYDGTYDLLTPYLVVVPNVTEVTMVVFHCGALVHVGNALSPECNNSIIYTNQAEASSGSDIGTECYLIFAVRQQS